MESPAPKSPLGVKVVGEGGAEGIAATLTDAVEDALSPLTVTIGELPLKPEGIWRLIQERRTED